MTLDDVIGQPEAVGRLKALAKRSRTGNPVHFLLVGPEGSGKRTLAQAFACEVGTNFVEVSSRSAIERGADLMGILTNLAEHDVLFIQELEWIPRSVEDSLPPALREFSVPFVIDRGTPHARTLNYKLQRFTCVVAARREADVPARLRPLFPIAIQLRPYTEDALSKIAPMIANAKSIQLTPDAALLLARTARGSLQQLNSMIELLRPSTARDITGEDAANTLLSLGFKVVPGGEANAPGGSGVDDLMHLTGVEFEHVMAEFLRGRGFRTEVTQATGDGGIDIVAELEQPIVGGRYLIQCKRFTPDTLVGAPVVRELYGAFRADRRAIKAILITTSDFTAQARQFAEGLPIELIGGEQLKALLGSQ